MRPLNISMWRSNIRKINFSQNFNTYWLFAGRWSDMRIHLVFVNAITWNMNFHFLAHSCTVSVSSPSMEPRKFSVRKIEKSRRKNREGKKLGEDGKSGSDSNLWSCARKYVCSFIEIIACEACRCISYHWYENRFFYAPRDKTNDILRLCHTHPSELHAPFTRIENMEFKSEKKHWAKECERKTNKKKTEMTTMMMAVATTAMTSIAWKKYMY